MRFSSTLLLALPALAVAQEQVPLADKVKGWFNKAQSYVSSAVPAVPSPADAGAAKVAEYVVTPLKHDNWKSVITPDASAAGTGPEEWMIFVTGGNKTCYGLCGNVTAAWNKSVPLIAARPNAPHLAIVDCEAEPVLCNTWAVGPPSVFWFSIPKALPDQSRASTTVRYIPLNRTSTTTTDIAEIATKDLYKNTEPYEGAFHPFDGWLAQTGLATPLAHALYYFSLMPSWLPMIAISFLSRSFMSRRMQQPAPRGGAPAAGAAPAAR